MDRELLRKSIIVGSILICLLSIRMYKYNFEKKLNDGLMKGFEYYTESDYTLTKDITSGYPMVLVLGSKMCKACEDVSLITKKLNLKYQGVLKIKYVDILKNKEMKDKFKPRVTPTMFFINSSGKIMYYIEGTTTEKTILESIEMIGVELIG